MDKSFANLVFNILVIEGGASESSRAEFIHWFTDHKRLEYGFSNEFRFLGLLEFGGKFWIRSDGFSVSCYPEDVTAKNKKIIAKINALLKGVTL